MSSLDTGSIFEMSDQTRWGIYVQKKALGQMDGWMDGWMDG